ncbi:MAG: hypothetical protein ACTHLW_00175 [Verrucomicrobiota bacterium]
MKNQKLTLITLVALLATTTLFAAENWKETLRKELPLLGHRN